MEFVRPWDPTDKYSGALLREYAYWTLEVSFRQSTLGQLILFCHRPGVRLFSQTTDPESAELKLIQEDAECALRRADAPFRADHFNWLQLGNELPLLHYHCVPRYESPRQFFGREWRDPNPRYLPEWAMVESDRDLVLAIRDVLKPLLQK